MGGVETWQHPDQRRGLSLARTSYSRYGGITAGAHLARVVRGQMQAIYFAVPHVSCDEGAVPTEPTGLLVPQVLHLRGHSLQRKRQRSSGQRGNQQPGGASPRKASGGEGESITCRPCHSPWGSPKHA